MTVNITVYNNGELVHSGTLAAFLADNDDEWLAEQCEGLEEAGRVEFSAFSGDWVVERQDVARIRAELERIGVADLGPVDSIVCGVDGADVYLADDGGRWDGTAVDALARLAKLPDGSGWEAFWEVFAS